MATSSVIKPTSTWRHLKWYEYVPNRDRLDLWVRSKAPGRITSLRFDLRPEKSGWFDPNTRAIGVNPTSVGKTPREQWVGTRAIALHEAGHALHTGNLGTGLLHHVANILEDQRIEWLMCNADPAMTKEMRFKNRWRWKETPIATAANDEPEHILETALLHRWEWWLGLSRPKPLRRTASRRAAPPKGAVSKIVLCTENQKRWDTVRPWVESAWVAETSDAVVAIARRILDFLKLPETLDLPNLIVLIAKTDGIAMGTSAPITGAPHAPTSHSSGGDGATDHSADDRLPEGDDPDGGNAGADRADLHSSLNPNYVEYVDAVAPWVRQLAARLERPTPRVRIIPNSTRGRYSLRADLHDSDRPFLARTAPAIAPGLAVEILGDQSGSMGTATSPTDGSSKMNAARLGVMTLHLACEVRRIPHAIMLFDGFFSVLEYNGDAQIASALVAGWDGFTGQEHVSQHMRRRAPKLLARPEGTKLMIVVHDGYPVATGDPEDIVRFQKEYAGRIHVVGVYLCDEKGGSPHEIAQMQSLFATLIVAKPSELSDKLGDLIAALA